MDDEFSKHEELCEGIDNIERINRHFEKTLVEKYKAKQVHMQQNNANNVPNTMHQSIPNLNSNPGSAMHPNPSIYGTPLNNSHHPNFQNQTSLMKSSTMNDSKKKPLVGQKSLTFFEMNTTNIKYFDSTVLHFSTTYDNTNTSAITLPDESTDSIDELNANQNLLNLDFILLPENAIYFKILDLFSIMSEKVHETLSTKYQNTFETEQSTEDYIPSPDITINPNHLRSRPQSDKEKALESSSIITEHPSDSPLKIYIKGVPVNPTEENNTLLIKKRTNIFLLKYEKRLSWILNQVDMSSPYFYDMETEQLEILESYLYINTSKIVVFEVVDNIFELLLLVKKQLVELSSSFLTVQGETNTTNTHMNSPNLTAKAPRKGSIIRDLPTPSAPASSTNITNHILKSILKPNPSSRNVMHLELSPQKALDSTEKDRGRPGTIIYSMFNNSFAYKHKALFMSYLGIISQLIVRSPKMDLYALFYDVYASNEGWAELVKLFTTSIFREIMVICDRHGDSNEVHLEKDQVHLFIYAKKAIEYYTSILVMCYTTIFKENLNSSLGDPAKKKKKNGLRKLLQSMLYLLKPSGGLLSNYISMNTNINSVIISTRIQSLSNYNSVRLNLFKAIYDFLKKAFSFNARFSCFLTDEIATFYIRYSYINFVKLYSHSSNSELNEINRKIVEVGNRVKGKVGPENFNENIDRIENEFNTQNFKGVNIELKTYQLHLSKLYMKVLLAIAKNRNDDIKHKFYQYRILEFFTREVDLEFDVSFF